MSSTGYFIFNYFSLFFCFVKYCCILVVLDKLNLTLLFVSVLKDSFFIKIDSFNTSLKFTQNKFKFVIKQQMLLQLQSFILFFKEVG